ncbi:Asd/ArgC dimerization domain-containing protein [Fontimonas sp. SYSU GA230001]|uniref:aspartate-semialdehyde dehydrogenase n=1 Tax=Fontimonas sp. SYSU GA230001 TaxID=3142450 RepID=UPI0032B4F607
MSRRFDVAVLGADSAVGAAVLELLAERRFPLGELSALTLDGEEAATVEFAGNPLPLEDAVGFGYGQVQLAFLAGDDPRYVAEAERAADAGCIVIDASGQDWRDPQIPRVVTSVNPVALADFNERGIVAAPDRIITALLPALDALDRVGGLQRVTATVIVPVSDAGRAGQEDLARETAALLNARAYERRVFPQQIAFNVLGQLGATGEDGRTGRERRIVGELRVLLNRPELPVGLQLVHVASFFGYAMSLELALERMPEASVLVEALAGAPGVEVADSPDPADCPSPVVDATRSAVVRVARLRLGAGPQALALWLTADNIRYAAALNAVTAAEILARDHL